MNISWNFTEKEPLLPLLSKMLWCHNLVAASSFQSAKRFIIALSLSPSPPSVCTARHLQSRVAAGYSQVSNSRSKHIVKVAGTFRQGWWTCNRPWIPAAKKLLQIGTMYKASQLTIENAHLISILWLLISQQFPNLQFDYHPSNIQLPRYLLPIGQARSCMIIWSEHIQLPVYQQVSGTHTQSSAVLN